MKFYDDQIVIISQEEFRSHMAQEGFTSNVVDFFKDAIPSLINNLKIVIDNFSNKADLQQIVNINNGFSKLSRGSIPGRFLELSETVVQVPESFKGEFLPYCKELTDIGLPILDNTKGMFKEYNLVVSMAINDPKNLESTKVLKKGYEEFTGTRERIKSRLSKYFVNNVNSRARLKHIFPRYRDLEEHVSEIRKLDSIVKYSNLKQIQDEVKKLASLLEVLEGKLKRKEIEFASKEVVSYIAEGAYEIAKYIDQIVVYQYQAMSLMGSTNNLLDKLNSLN